MRCIRKVVTGVKRQLLHSMREKRWLFLAEKNMAVLGADLLVTWPEIPNAPFYSRLQESSRRVFFFFFFLKTLTTSRWRIISGTHECGANKAWKVHYTPRGKLEVWNFADPPCISWASCSAKSQKDLLQYTFASLLLIDLFIFNDASAKVLSSWPKQKAWQKQRIRNR